MNAESAGFPLLRGKRFLPGARSAALRAPAQQALFHKVLTHRGKDIKQHAGLYAGAAVHLAAIHHNGVAAFITRSSPSM